MATHKVPQDVEADDKLVGFLSLKQFIFTVLGLGFGYLTFFFATKVHIVSAIIWIPPTIICLVLGLYQRKDQPVEVYLASAIRFYLKPHKRKWSLEGYEERVIITAPPKVEHHYTKNFTGEEATSRLGNLSRLMDSRGWATKLNSEWQNPQLATAAAADRLVQPGTVQNGIDLQSYMQPADVMDERISPVAQQFQSKIDQADTTTRQRAIAALQQARESAAAPERPSANIETSATPDIVPQYNRYPEMHQKVISPHQQEVVAPTTPESAAPNQQPKPSLVQQPIQNTSQVHPESSPIPTPKPRSTPDGSVEIRLH